jgi:predicted helicase
VARRNRVTDHDRHCSSLRLDFGGRAGQCLPFYTYNEDGTNRRENITDWALEQFRSYYKDKSITKWDIFNYVYAVLHHPLYRERYAANLKRELPRIPFALDFKEFVDIGKRLAEIHVNYEQQPEYPLERIETPGKPLDWRVEKMKLSKDKRSLIYNDFLTLSGIPPEALEYRLGNRSALEWIIDQYQVSTDKRSGITNDPNRADDPQYIQRLIAQVITVSLETAKLVGSLNSLELVSNAP